MKRQLRDKDHEIEMLKANVSACEGVIKVFDVLMDRKLFILIPFVDLCMPLVFFSYEVKFFL